MTIRVLIVDDSPLVRGVLTALLDSAPDIEVVGEASNGLEAQRMVRSLQPDVVTMDVVMPMMGGMEAIEAIMDRSPVPIVVVADAQGDAEGLAMDALDRGATDVFAKPRKGLDSTAAQDLANTLRRAASIQLRAKGTGRKRHNTLSSFAIPRATRHGLVIGLVGSTGGPGMVRSALEHLPRNFSHTLMICQHTTPGFTESLAIWLDSVSKIRVKVAADQEQARPGTAYIAPDGTHLIIDALGILTLDDGPPVDGHRPSCTVMLDSIATSYGDRGVGVVITGMGRDGADGLAAIEKHGGLALVEDPETAIVGGMPREAIAACLKPIIIRADALGWVLDRLGKSGPHR